MQDYSIGELESLVFKAYRGAGFSWGLAQEAGAAAAWLAMHGISAATPLSTLLQLIDNTPAVRLAPLNRTSTLWTGNGEYLCPIITGAALSDFGLDNLTATQSRLLERIIQPILLLPFLGRLPQSSEIRFDEAVYLCGDNKLQVISVYVDKTDHSPLDVVIGFSEQVPAQTARLQRATVEDGAAEVLLEFAHRTYVPATEDSRLAGAGAGLLDND